MIGVSYCKGHSLDSQAEVGVEGLLIELQLADVQSMQKRRMRVLCRRLGSGTEWCTLGGEAELELQPPTIMSTKEWPSFLLHPFTHLCIIEMVSRTE